ncbi:P-loop containing nucleoside triphosphate hydrolase protein [Butyriboletus roseoflavus]|nr:P-loop containing nucleoside triphosphate hydrolase protein [Butyriboletus roseoflavus]
MQLFGGPGNLILPFPTSGATFAVHNSAKSIMIRTKDRFKADPSDLVILVMGPTGCGKSNFINTLMGKAEQRTAANLRSDTRDVTPYCISDNGRRLVLVDTPGFDDTYRPDSEILRLIANWLTQKYPDGATLKIAGIIYLHRITDNRMSGSAYKNLQMFGRLCGNIPLPRARLVTTMWDKAKDLAVAQNREAQLRNEFWWKLLNEGAVAKRFNNTQFCAWGIVRELTELEKGKDGEDLLLQEEIVEQHKRLSETEAGKILYSRVQKLLEEQKKTLKSLADEAKLANDPSLARSLQEEYEKTNVQLQKTFDEMRMMKIPLTRRILLWLSGRKSRAQAVKFD